MPTYDELIAKAREAGAEHGRAVASWYFDGDTSDETYRIVLQGLQDGDPAILDTFPSAPLSGEWAGEPTPAAVLAELGVDAEAAAVLRTIPAGAPEGARARAIAVALEALIEAAKPRKAAAKPKPSRHVTWMLKQRFPGEPNEWMQRSMYRDLMGRPAPEITGPAAAQFAYGSRSGPNRRGKGDDAAVLAAARV